jgi:hypothetical protein
VLVFEQDSEWFVIVLNHQCLVEFSQLSDIQSTQAADAQNILRQGELNDNAILVAVHTKEMPSSKTSANH